jgi:tyrosyl-tRNA synthetase
MIFLNTNILDLITKVSLAGSKGEAMRLVSQGGVSIDGEKITDITSNINITGEHVLKVGKRKFIKLKI